MQIIANHARKPKVWEKETQTPWLYQWYLEKNFISLSSFHRVLFKCYPVALFGLYSLCRRELMQIAEIPFAFSFIEYRLDNKMCILRELFSAFLLISLLQIDDPSKARVWWKIFFQPFTSPPFPECFAFKT